MAASFTIAPTVASFRALVQGSRQEAGEVQRLTLGVFIDDPAEWANLLLLVTSKYHVHSPLGGDIVVDVVRGAGEGYLMVDDLGEGYAVMVGLDRDRFLPNGQTFGTATFLVTGGFDT